MNGENGKENRSTFRKRTYSLNWDLNFLNVHACMTFIFEYTSMFIFNTFKTCLY